MKDQCPNCGHRFGLTGAPFAQPPGKSRPAYYCPECGIQLTRSDATVERIAAYIGYGALLIAGGMTLWNLVGERGNTGQTWLTVLYVLAIAGIGTHLVYGFTRQHYLAQAVAGDTSSDERAPRPDQPAD